MQYLSQKIRYFAVPVCTCVYDYEIFPMDPVNILVGACMLDHAPVNN